MKHIKLIFFRALLLISCLFFFGDINAYDFKVNGLCYNILSDSTVELTWEALNTPYTGKVVVPSSVTYNSKKYDVISIGESAMANVISINSTWMSNDDLVSVSLPSSIVDIGNWAFAACRGLTSITIPNSVTSIGDHAFSGCSGFTSISIPNSVTNIGEGAFGSCINLTSIKISDSLTKIESGLFSNCSGLTSIEIPNSVMTIGDVAFDGCSGLTSITIPTSVTSVGTGVFRGCSGITTMIVDNGNIKYDSRNNCNAIIETSSNALITGCKTTTIPNTVISIGNNAFSNCSGLTSIEIPSSVTSIDDWAFSQCIKLNSMIIPNNVTSIKETAFSGCSGLASIKVELGNAKYDSRNDCNAIIETSTNKLISGCMNTTVPSSVTCIGEGAFSGCSNLYSLIIPNSVTSIERVAFYGCSSLSSITIPNSVISIGEYAFRGCSGLKSVRSEIQIPFGIDESVFSKISSNVILQVPKGTKSKYQVFSGWTKYFNEIVEIDVNSTTYTLSITSSGNGSASYNGTSIRSKTGSFTVNEGTSATIIFSPDNGYRIKIVKVNNSTVSVRNNQYTVSDISRNTTVEIEFEEILQAFSVDDVNYTVVSVDERTIRLAKGSYNMMLEVPAKVNYQNAEWTVTGIDNGALVNNSYMAAIIWHPDAAFTEQVSNPNLLLYVDKAEYAPSSLKNVVVNGSASSITLTDAASGNNFHCPQTFTAQKISYTHNYSMETGIGEAKGWETIALPFDVQKVTHESKGEIVSFANWRSGDAKKPFWLMQLSGSGWTMATSIKANTPYIISMPNNQEYKAGFLLNGSVTFSAENVTIQKTDNLSIANYSDRTFVPTFTSMERSNDVLALNVVNDIERFTGGSTEGSMFERNLRVVHPFEAYMTSTSSTRSIGIDEGMATDIIELIWALSDGVDRIYNLNGQLIKIEEGRSLDEVIKDLPAGVYIVNGKKLIIK